MIRGIERRKIFWDDIDRDNFVHRLVCKGGHILNCELRVWQLCEVLDSLQEGRLWHGVNLMVA
jgi:hypothetical protein